MAGNPGAVGIKEFASTNIDCVPLGSRYCAKCSNVLKIAYLLVAERAGPMRTQGLQSKVVQALSRIPL